MKAFALGFILLCLTAASSAQARDIRFPESGYPAFTFTVPDDWTVTPDSDGNMIITAADKSVALSLSLGAAGESLDDIASAVFKAAEAAPPRRGEPISLSGFNGYVYYSTMSNSSGVHLNVKVNLVKTDATHFASCGLISADFTTPPQMDAGNSVMSSIAVITSP